MVPRTDIRNWAQSLVSQGDRNFSLAGQSLFMLQEVIDRLGTMAGELEERLGEVLARVTSLEGKGGLERVEIVSLTADRTIDIPVDVIGRIIAYIIKQDAAGGWKVTWNAAFGSPGQTGQMADTYSVFRFYKDAGPKLRLLHGPILNRPI